MTQTVNMEKQGVPKAFWLALGLNFIWINIAEVVRYFALVKPMLHAAFPNTPNIALGTPEVVASWMVWDTVLVLAATGFYWMFFRQFGRNLLMLLLGATSFTITVFGLLWVGVVNMGLAPADFIWVATPLAWGEQMIAAFIVYWAMGRAA